MNKLKSCPFCGTNDWLYHIVDENTINTSPIEDELQKRIAELEEKQRWIPVSERLPDNWESVLTIDISKSTRDMVTAFYNPETSLWSTHFSMYSDSDLWVTHWMPLPESPIVYGKERE